MPIPKTSTVAKIAALALAGTMAVALSACGSSKPADNSNNANNANNANTQVSQTSNTTENANTANTENTETQAPVSATPTTTFNTPGYLNRIPSLDENQEARVAGFQINGVALTGNQHDNSIAIANGYLAQGIQSEFYLNEWISIYLDDASLPMLSTDTSVVAVPHQDIETYKMALKTDLLMMAESSGGFVFDVSPENIVVEDGLNFIGNGYVNMDIGQVGEYDIIFCKGELPAYYVTVHMLPAVG